MVIVEEECPILILTSILILLFKLIYLFVDLAFLIFIYFFIFANLTYDDDRCCLFACCPICTDLLDLVTGIEDYDLTFNLWTGTDIHSSGLGCV